MHKGEIKPKITAMIRPKKPKLCKPNLATALLIEFLANTEIKDPTNIPIK